MTTAVRSAQQVSRSGEFDLGCDAVKAFPLFSPEGERHWIQEWDPQPVFPDTIAFARDTVFREGEALWTIVDVDWQAFRAEYVRVAPSHAVHIVVKIESLGSGGCRVAVSYNMTAFGESAAALLEEFSENAYAAKMENWERQIREHLSAENERP